MTMYVDGFNLYHGLHDWARCKWLWLDLEALGTLLRPQAQLTRVKYFTAPVLNDPGGASRQQTYQNALTSHCQNVTIIQGRYQSKLRTCRKCGHTYTLYEEKETDVNIASELISDAASGSCDTALMVTADSDLLPAVRAARRINPKLFVLFAFPPNRHSQDIKTQFPASFSIGKGRIRQAQLPQSVPGKASGKSFHRPDKWK
ncbi:NYN domain-containing protein [Nocardioides caldifontis]|uniref:NYN domain-containing protein n=1 Tax=Nocardioides caldifontis TaxID=2588938 RepID=UPI0011E01B56|nr:NYN domain-containing protein [Nocardioides caldifontis]